MPIESGWAAVITAWAIQFLGGFIYLVTLGGRVKNLEDDVKGLPDRVTRIEAMHSDVKEMKKDIKLITKALLQNCPRCQIEEEL